MLVLDRVGGTGLKGNWIEYRRPLGDFKARLDLR